jgi:hypothetical protein
VGIVFENNICGFVLISNIRSFMSNMSDIDTGDEMNREYFKIPILT